MRNLRLVVITVVLAATAVLSVACRGGGGSQPYPAATLTAEQRALAPSGATLGSLSYGDVIAWLSSEPGEPVEGAAEIDAYLVGSGGQPITDAKVTFDTDMTNMSHGSYLVPAIPAGEGHYVGQIHFSMRGPWRVIAIIERPGSETARLRFEFPVKAK